MTLLKEGNPLIQAAVRAGMSEPTARKYARSGQMPSAVKTPHTWRTRQDPYEGVWPEVEALLRQDAGLEAKTIWIKNGAEAVGSWRAAWWRPSSCSIPSALLRQFFVQHT
jgi:hypothetical protein